MKILIKFTKMHGLGNDFVMIDRIRQNIEITPTLIRSISDRKFGIGCDQVLVIEAPTNPNADFLYKIFNADGSEAEQCGNGARCFARFVTENELTNKKQIVLETSNNIFKVHLHDNDNVAVEMGQADFYPNIEHNLSKSIENNWSMNVHNTTYPVYLASLGNPHCIIFINDLTEEANNIYEYIKKNDIFPLDINLGLVQIIDKENIRLRTFERGVGETLACGSNATAAVAVGIKQGLLDKQVNVALSAGILQVSMNEQLILTGPTSKIFDGSFAINKSKHRIDYGTERSNNRSKAN